MEIANVFESVSKEKFRSAANKLLGECFLLKKLCFLMVGCGNSSKSKRKTKKSVEKS